MSLWFVYLKYMLPKRLQSEMVTQWVYGLYTSGICYPRGYKEKWLNSEFLVCIPQVYVTQEVTKWNADTVSSSYGLYTSGICYPRGYQVKWWHSELKLWFVYLSYMLPKRLPSERMTQWVNGFYTSAICYLRGYKLKLWHSEGFYTLLALYIDFVN